jgi:hypothetical protein
VEMKRVEVAFTCRRITTPSRHQYMSRGAVDSWYLLHSCIHSLAVLLVLLAVLASGTTAGARRLQQPARRARGVVPCISPEHPLDLLGDVTIRRESSKVSSTFAPVPTDQGSPGETVDIFPLEGEGEGEGEAQNTSSVSSAAATPVTYDSGGELLHS